MTTMNNEDPADPSVHVPRELPEPAAWVRDLASPQPHCVTSLRYRSKSDADAGTWYVPLYTADQMREAVAAERERHAKAARAEPEWRTHISSVEVGFKFDTEAATHTPTALVRFEPVAANAVANAGSWPARDAFAKWLMA